MKNIFLMGACFFFTCTTLYAQVFRWSEGNYALSDDYNSPSGVALDSKGNVYIGGSFTGSMTMGNKVLNSRGKSDIFIAKYNQTNGLEWVIQEGGTENDYLYDLGIDRSDQLFATGNFSGTVTFGSTTLVSSNTGGFYLTKYQSDGQMVWVSQAGGAFLQGLRIVFDHDDNLFVSGDYYKRITFGSRSLPAPSRGSDPFIAKFNGNGNVVWAQYIRDIGCCVGASAPAATIDTFGNVYITGSYMVETQIGPVTLPYVGDYSMYLAKLDKTGEYLWVKSIISDTDYQNSVSAAEITIDSKGEIIVVGSFNGEARFDDITLVNNEIPTLGFLARFNTSGMTISATPVIGNDLRVHSIRLDEHDNFYIAGNFRGNGQFGTTTLDINLLEAFVAKGDKNGIYQYAISTNSEYYASAREIEVIDEDNLVLTGSFHRGNTYLGCDTLFTNGLSSYFTVIAPSIASVSLAIDGPTELCIEQEVTYTVPQNLGDGQYEWTIPEGFIANSGTTVTTENFITLTAGTEIQNGVLNVRFQGCNASGASEDLLISVNGYPEKPEITVSECDLSLQSSSTGNNQWYKDGIIIEGADQNSFRPKAPGSYTLQVSGACGDVTSDPIEVFPIIAGNVVIQNLFLPEYIPIFEAEVLLNSNLEIFTATGSLVFEASGYQNNWDVGHVADGIYFYRLQSPCLDNPLRGRLLILNN